MRSNHRIRTFLASWLASLAALALAALVLRYVPLGDDALSLSLPWALPGILAALGAWLASRIAGKPLAAASRAAAKLAEGDESAFRELAGVSELAGIAKAMSERAAARSGLIDEAGRASEERAAALSGAMEELRTRDEARARESRMAARMQRRIVPREEALPARREVAFGAAYYPAENTGGDLYDAIRAGKNGVGLLAADVSGRGVTAALIAALVKNAFRSRAGWDADPSVVMAAVDEELRPVIEDTDHFVTAFFALLDLETGLLRYANAGHPPALVLSRRRMAVEELDASGPPLGVQPEASFRAGERRLEEGDRILLFTDGLTGSRDYRGEAFGRDRLSAAFRDSAHQGAAESAEAIAKTLESFRIGAPRTDDLVALVCEFRAFARPEDQSRRRPPEREDWRILAKRGSELAMRGRIEEAVGAYERLLSLEPSDATALNNLGTLYWRLGRRDEAALRFREAAAIDPADPRIQRNLLLADKYFPPAAPAPEPPAAPVPEARPAAERPRDAPPRPVASLLREAAAVVEAEAAEEAEPVEEAEAVEEAEEVEEVEEAEPVEEYEL